MENGPENDRQAHPVVTQNDLDAYYRSIEGPFHETLRGLAGGNSAMGLVLLILLFSIIPVIPYLLSRAAFLLVGSLSVTLWSFHLRLASFWLWWIIMCISSIGLVAYERRFIPPTSELKERWLSPRQMRFAYCFGAVQEIRNYRTNHLPRHIGTASAYLVKIGNALMRASTLDLAEGAYPYHYWQEEVPSAGRENEYHRSVGIRLNRPKWYRLEPNTEMIVQAFPKFLAILGDRLKDRKDLAEVQSVLTNLATYLYTEIPEVAEDKSQAALENAGMESLLRFARQINELPPYFSEPAASTRKEQTSAKILSLIRKCTGLFMSENVLLSFLAWYALFLILFSGGFYLMFRYVPTLKMDTTVVATLVGGPIATAVTAVALPRLSKSEKLKG